MSRPRRLGLALLALAAAVSLLSACDKPIPQITALANNTVTQLKAQNYCFDSAHCKTNINQDLPTLKVSGGSSIQVDVPAAVADTAWFVTTFAAAADGTTTTIAGTGNLTNTHHASLFIAPYRPGVTFFLAVQSTRGVAKGGEWQTRVEVVN